MSDRHHEETPMSFLAQLGPRLLKYLLPMSVLYLALPYVIFFAGWLNWYFACVGIGLTLLPVYLIFKNTARLEQRRVESELSLRRLGQVIFVALILLLISGIGGYGFQDEDWLKHNTIFKNLIEQPWPVIYDLEGTQAPLVYYIAYYLPAALVGKVGGWFWANQALFLWSFIGLTLAIVWFMKLVRHPSALWFFLIFSGLDIVGQLTIVPLAYNFGGLGELSWDHIEWWSIGWQYASNATLLFWVPNQALSGWIMSAITLYTLLETQDKSSSVFFISLTMLWSPFITLGLLPYWAVDFLTDEGNWAKRLKPHISPTNICGAFLTLIIGLFYLAKFGPLPLGWESDLVHGFVFQFAESLMEKIAALVLIPLFCLLEFGLYAFFIARWNPASELKAKWIFITTLMILTFLPFYRYGYWNDLPMRASIPGLFFLAVFLNKLLGARSLNKTRRVILVVLLVLGSVTPFIEYQRHLKHIWREQTLSLTPEFVDVQGLLQHGDEALQETPQLHALLLQYIGSPYSLFFKVMARKGT